MWFSGTFPITRGPPRCLQGQVHVSPPSHPTGPCRCPTGKTEAPESFFSAILCPIPAAVWAQDPLDRGRSAPMVSGHRLLRHWSRQCLEKPQVWTLMSNVPRCKYWQRVLIFKISVWATLAWVPRCAHPPGRPTSRGQALRGHLPKGPLPPPQGGGKDAVGPAPPQTPALGHPTGLTVTVLDSPMAGGRGPCSSKECLTVPTPSPVVAVWWVLRTAAWGPVVSLTPGAFLPCLLDTSLSPGHKQGWGTATHLVPGVAPWSGRSSGGLRDRYNSQPKTACREAPQAGGGLHSPGTRRCSTAGEGTE